MIVLKKRIVYNFEPKRLDVFLASELDLTRSKVNNLIKDSKVLINNNEVKSGYLLKSNDIIDITLEEENTDLKPSNIDLDIVYEDDDVIVINKQNGLVVHPSSGNYEDTLVNGLLYHSKNLSSVNGEFRPGIVHRIDADTTGLLMIAKNDYAHNVLARQLESHSINRVYIALVWGTITNDSGTIDAPIGRDSKNRKKMAVTIDGKKAITHFKVLERYKNATLLEVKLETGRTHQIRVHMKYINHPIVNDSVYGDKKNIFDDTGQCLHARTIGFIHPTKNEYMEYTSELPDCFVNILEKIKNG